MSSEAIRTTVNEMEIHTKSQETHPSDGVLKSGTGGAKFHRIQVLEGENKRLRKSVAHLIERDAEKDDIIEEMRVQMNQLTERIEQLRSQALIVGRGTPLETEIATNLWIPIFPEPNECCCVKIGRALRKFFHPIWTFKQEIAIQTLNERDIEVDEIMATTLEAPRPRRRTRENALPNFFLNPLGLELVQPKTSMEDV